MKFGTSAKRTLKFIMSILLIFLTVGCAEQKHDYESLSASDKALIDGFYSHIDEWELTTLEWANVAVSGEDIIRNVYFTDYKGNKNLAVIYTLDYGSDLVFKYYSYNDGEVECIASLSGGTTGNAMPKSYYTTWSEQRKKDYLAEKLCEYYNN